MMNSKHIPKLCYLLSITDPHSKEVANLSYPLEILVENSRDVFEAYCEYLNISVSGDSLKEVLEGIGSEFFSLYRELKASDDLNDDAKRLLGRFGKILGQAK